MELGTAALLALATMASVWCAYQSERWSGVQVFRLNHSDVAGREGVELSVRASNAQLLDAAMFMHFMTAWEQDNKALQQFYLAHFRPEMKTAMDAWLATRPMTNPDAPLNPFVMPEYRLALAEQADAARQKAADEHEAAVEAKHESDQYIFLTVLLASVLFFGGIAVHFEWPKIKIAVFMVGMLVFLASLLWLGTCPIAP